MLRTQTFTNLRRLYHSSPRRINGKEPVVKAANSRVAATLRKRLAAEYQPAVSSYDPSTKFEPFPFVVNENNKTRILNSTITPLHEVPYEEQLLSKESHCRNALRHFAQELYRSGTPVRLNVSRLPCHVKPIIRSPILNNYRNKDEFSIWRGYDGKQIVVGHLVFPIGKHGDSVCVEPNGSPVMREESIKVANLLQDFIRNQAKLSVCYSLGTDGGWRRFAVRSNSDGELLVFGIVNPRTLTFGQVNSEKENYKAFVVQKCNEVGLKLRSLYFQACPSTSCLHRDSPYQLMYGDPTISETINGFKFRVSPEAYMPASSVGTGVLYRELERTIDEAYPTLGSSKKKPLVIDGTCGIGIGSVHLAERASRVIGVDNRDQAIDDAKYNAKANGIENAEFICSELRIVLDKILERNTKSRDEVLVLATPPKSGLPKSIVETLKKCRDVTRIIYVAPRVEGPKIHNNLIELCSRSNDSSRPFMPVMAVPVDTTPHVEQYETIIFLERLP